MRIRPRQWFAFCPVRFRNARDVAKSTCQIHVTNWQSNGFSRCVVVLRRRPDKGKSHECINVIRTLEQQSEVTLKFTMVSGKYDVCIFIPTFLPQPINHLSTGFIDQFIFDMGHGINFSHLIRCHLLRDEFSRRFKVRPEATFVVPQPMFWFC